MSELNKFISTDLAIAPTFKFNSLNLFLREVKLDYNSSFQVGSPKSNAILLPEEVNLLKSDYVRLASICTRLIKLLGASCSEEEDYNGFTAEPRNEFLSVMVWTGRPIVKSIPGI